MLVFSVFSGYFFNKYIIDFSNFYIFDNIFEVSKSLLIFKLECFYQIFFIFLI